MAQNTVYSINGPVVKVREAGALQMQEKVFVGHKRLIGEVISVGSGETTIQVYEGTTGMRPGEPVEGTGGPMCAALGPGILSNIFDGIERPLREIAAANGAFIPAGGDLPALDMQKKWDVAMRVREGDRLTGGQIFAVCPETSIIEHRAMVPPGLSGTAVDVRPDGAYTAGEALLTLQDDEGQEHPLSLTQFWPIREPRPVARRLPIDRPLITGQRVIDTLFPVAKGGTAAIPGGFGTGKTMTQHQLAKWSDADIIVYIGCGERGNEMTQVLKEFGELEDPKSKKPLTDRTVLIANTSNMPVAAREASSYTGITLAEYYRGVPAAEAPRLGCDLRIEDPALLDMDCVESLEQLEPFGTGNPRPTLCIVDALLERVRPIGGGRHLKLRLEKGGVCFDCVMFSRREEELGAREGDRVDAAFYPQINEYHGQRSVQLLMTELRQTDTLPLCLDILEDRLPGPWTSSDLYPERSDFIRVWRWLERRGGSAGGEVSDLPGWRPGGMHPAKLLLCLRVMRDEGLVKARRSGDSIRVEVCPRQGKADLASHPIIVKLRSYREKFCTGRWSR